VDLVPELLDGFLAGYMFQPATAFWRAVEIACVLEQDFPQGRGLDLGCGDGKLTKLVADRLGHEGRRWVGIDLDAGDVGLAKERGLYEKLHVASIAAIPEPDASFDFVFSNSVLEHVAPIEGALAETSRVLKKGGIAVFTVPSSDYHATLRGPLLPWVSREKYLRSIDRRVNHLRYWSLDEWTSALARHGMRVAHTEHYLSRGEMQRYENLVRMTSGVVSMFFGEGTTTQQMQQKLRLRRQSLPVPRSVRALVGKAMLAGVDRRNAPFGGLYLRVCKD
jgi:ubiquinone/menaquinone biosynthesis C-methylase UbiE